MNALFLVSCAALAACSSGQLLNYNGFYPGFYSGYYPSLYSNFAGLPISYTAAPKVSIKTTPALAAPAITSYNLAAPAITSYNLAAPAITSYNLAAPVASLAPVGSPVQSQYHAQDELGQYSFGYAGGPSARQETRDAFGNVRGSVNYVDSNGVVQTQHYVADALGYRVSATNLPVAPDAPAVAPLAAPQETPEVAAARAEHQRAHAEAAAAAAAAPDTDVVVSRKKRDAQFVSTVGAPLRFSYGFNTLNYGTPFAGFAGLPAATTYSNFLAPRTYSNLFAPTSYSNLIAPGAVTTYNAAAAAAPRDATLLKVVHNPGHATSYRVD